MFQTRSLGDCKTTKSPYVRSEGDTNNNDNELHSNMMPIFFLMQVHITSGS